MNTVKKETIDLTPTWKGLIPFLLTLYRGAKEAEEILFLDKEFVKIAKGADAYTVYTNGEASFDPFFDKIHKMLNEFLNTPKESFRGSKLELEFEYMAFLCDEYIQYQKLQA